MLEKLPFCYLSTALTFAIRKFLYFPVIILSVFQTQNSPAGRTKFYLPAPFSPSTCFSISLSTSVLNMGKTRDCGVRDGFRTVKKCS